MTRRFVRTFALLATLLVLAGQAALATASSTPFELTKPVQATKEDLDPVRTYSGPFVLADPENPSHVVASFVDLRTRRCGLLRSLDAGQTWKRLDASPALDSYPFCLSTNSNIFHGPLAFGRGGALYYGLAGWDLQDRLDGGGADYSIMLARSTDLGDTWQTPLVRNARGKSGDDAENNRPIGNIAVDGTSASADIVYVSWQFSTFIVPPNANPTKPAVAVSTDAGHTFGDPVDVAAPWWAAEANRTAAMASAPPTTLAPGVTTTTALPGSRASQPNQAANFGGRNVSVTVDEKGTAYALWSNTSINFSPAPLTGQFVSRSTDHGKTWTAAQAAPFDTKTGSVGRIAWSPGGGPQGTLHIVSNGTERNPLVSDVDYRRSTDGGKTWNTVKQLNDDDPAQYYGAFIPMIGVAPDGRVDVAWWDTRSDPGIRGNDVYYTYSNDAGSTWSKNIRITDQTVDRKLGVWGNNFDMSSPPGVASTNDFALFGWDDTRNSDVSSPASAGFGGGLQDVYTAEEQFQAIGGGTSKAARIALAAAIGLLAVGAILGIATLATRRRPAAVESP
jgi:hypothetical protein